MKKYLLFAIEYHYPKGGFGDLVVGFDNFEEIKDVVSDDGEDFVINKEKFKEFVESSDSGYFYKIQIVNTSNGEVVEFVDFYGYSEFIKSKMNLKIEIFTGVPSFHKEWFSVKSQDSRTAKYLIKEYCRKSAFWGEEIRLFCPENCLNEADQKSLLGEIFAKCNEDFEQKIKIFTFSPFILDKWKHKVIYLDK